MVPSIPSSTPKFGLKALILTVLSKSRSWSSAFALSRFCSAANYTKSNGTYRLREITKYKVGSVSVMRSCWALSDQLGSSQAMAQAGDSEAQ